MTGGQRRQEGPSLGPQSAPCMSLGFHPPEGGKMTCCGLPPTPPPSLRVLQPQDANTLSEAPALGRVSVWTHMQRHLGAIGGLVLSYPQGMVQNHGGWGDGVRLAAARFGAAWERSSLDIEPSQCPGGGPAWPSTSTWGPGSGCPVLNLKRWSVNALGGGHRAACGLASEQGSRCPESVSRSPGDVPPPATDVSPRSLVRVGGSEGQE